MDSTQSRKTHYMQGMVMRLFSSLFSTLCGTEQSRSKYIFASIILSLLAPGYCYALIAPGVIDVNQTICYGTAPATITNTISASGTGTLSYFWEFSTTSAISGYTTIPSTNTLSYSPGTLTITTWFRRGVTNGPETIYSDPVKITVLFPSNTMITANQTICSGSTPAQLIGLANDPSFSYQWLSSTTSAFTGFTPATGINNLQNYSPGPLTQSTWYTRVVSGICPNDTTPSIHRVKITVDPATIGGIVSGSNDTVCIGTNSTTFTLSGYIGTIQWQSSTTSATAGFSNISGANSSAYIANNLSVKTYYRAIVTSGTCAAQTSAVDSIFISAISVGGQVSGGNGGSTWTCLPTNSTTLTLTGYTGSILKWQSCLSLDFASGVTDISNTTNTLIVTNLSIKTYYRAVVQNGSCAILNSGIDSISIAPLVIGGKLTGGQTVCSGTNTTNFTLTEHNGAVLNWQWSTTRDFSSGINTIFNTSTSYQVNNLTSTRYYRAVIGSLHCIAYAIAYSSIDSIVIIPQAIGGILSGGTTVCSGTNSTLLTLSGSSGSIIRWEWAPDNTFSSGVVNLSNTSTTYTATNLTTTTTYYRAVLQNNSCPSVTSTIDSIVVTPQTVGGTLSPGGGVCPSPNSKLLTLTGYVGTIIKWQSSTSSNFSSGVTDITNTTNTYTATNLSATTYYRVVVQNGNCSILYSSISTINVSPPVIPGTLSGGNSYCSATNNTTLTLSGYVGGVVRWESSLTADFSSVPTPISNSTNTLNIVNQSSTIYYRALVSNSITCPGAYSTIDSIVVSPPSVGGIVSGNHDTVCVGTNTTTFTLSGHTGTIQWQASTSSATSGFSDISGANAATHIANNLSVKTYFRAIVISGICNADTSTVDSVVMNSLSIGGVVSGTNDSVCIGTNSTTLTLSGFTGTIQWQVSTSSATTGFSNVSGAIATTYVATNLSVKTYFRVTVTNGVCPAQTSVVDSIFVNSATVGGTISGTDSVCSGTNSTILTLSGYTGTVIRWESANNAAFTGIVTQISNSTITYTASNLSTTTYFRALLQNGNCPIAYSAIKAVIVVAPSFGGFITAPSTVCINTNSTILTISSYSGTILRWESSTTSNFSGTVTTIPFTGSSYTVTNISTPMYYRAVVQNGICPLVYSQVGFINVQTQPNPGAVVGGSNVCITSNSTLLTLVGYQGNIVRWESSNTSDFSGTITTITNTTATYGANNITTTTYYRAVVQYLNCATVNSGVAAITVAPLSLGGTVTSSNDTVCDGTNATTLTLTGYTGTIQWQASTSSTTAGYSNISGANAATYIANNLSVKTYFRAVVTSGVCPSDTSSVDSVLVNSISVGGIVSGNHDTVCIGSNSTTLTLTGYNGFIQWQTSTSSAAAGFSTISGANAATYIANNLAVKTYFRAVVTSGVCTSDTSSVDSVLVNSISVGGIVSGNHDTVCTGTNSTTLTLTGYIGTIQWQASTNSATTGFSNISGANAATYIVNNLSVKTYFRAVVTSGVCLSEPSSVDSIILNTPLTSNTISSSQTICAGSSPAPLIGATPSGGNGSTYTYTWLISTISASSGFTAMGGSNAKDYSPSLLTQQTWFKRVVLSGGCNNDTSNAVTIIMNGPIITNFISGAQTICSGNAPDSLIGSTPSGGNGSTYSYIWLSSTLSDSTGFVAASGIQNTQNYTPSILTQNTWYKRIVISGMCANDTSSSLLITVNKQIVYTLSVVPISIIYGNTVSLPTTVTVKYSDSTSATIPITWDTTGFNTNVGTYPYTGILSTVPGTCNTSNIKGTLILIIIPREITYKANDDFKLFGTLKTFSTNGNAVTLINGTLVASHLLNQAPVTSSGSIATAPIGIYPIYIDSLNLIILDGSSNNVTANYKINYYPGVLTVNNRIINLLVEKTTNDSTVIAGDSISYIITLTNNGPSTLSGGEIINVVDVPGSGLSIISYTPSTGSYDSNAGALTLSGFFAPGNTIILTVRAKVSASFSGDSIGNSVRVKLPIDITNTGDSTDTVYVSIIRLIDLGITKTADRILAHPTDTLNYTIVIHNNGPGKLYQNETLIIQEYLPDSLNTIMVNAVLPVGSSYNVLSGNFILGDTLEAGDSIVLKVSGMIHPLYKNDTIINCVKIILPEEIEDTNNVNDSTWIITPVKLHADSFDFFTSDQIICRGNVARMIVSSTGIVNPIYTWYSDSMLLNKLSTGNSYDTLLLNTATFYVTVKGDNKLENTPGTAKIITLTVHDYASDTMIVTNDTSVCYGKLATLIATPQGPITNPVFTWYASPSLTLPIATGDTFKTSTLFRDTLFYVTIKGSNLCESRELHIVNITIKRDCGNARFGLAKSLSQSILNTDGTYDLTFNFVAGNFGDEAIINVKMTDDLKPVFPNAQIKVLSVTTLGNFVLNLNYDGVNDIEMLGNGNRLNIGQKETITLLLNLKFSEDDTSTFFKNVAEIKGNSEVSGKPVDRKSQDGLSPDSTAGADTNYIPTPIVINRTSPKVTPGIFIPDGFSPNGDNVHDYFVIENPSEYAIYVAIYNRWGSIIYEKDNYDNSWDGKAKKGIIVNEGQGVPDGTYFYIVEYTNERGKRIKVAHSLTIAR